MKKSVLVIFIPVSETETEFDTICAEISDRFDTLVIQDPSRTKIEVEVSFNPY